MRLCLLARNHFGKNQYKIYIQLNILTENVKNSLEIWREKKQLTLKEFKIQQKLNFRKSEEFLYFACCVDKVEPLLKQKGLNKL